MCMRDTIPGQFDGGALTIDPERVPRMPRLG